MAQLERSSLLGFSAEQMLALVRDVTGYPAFLPACSAAHIELQEGDCTQAALSFSLAGLSESFSTENRVSEEADGTLHLDMRLLRGPFKSLTGRWTFQPLDTHACKASLAVELEWGSALLGRLLAPKLEQAIAAVMQAFKQRAMTIYAGAANDG